MTEQPAWRRRKGKRRIAVVAGLPGDYLKIRFESLGFPSCAFCDELVVEMNAAGVAGCRQRVDEFTKRIVEHTHEWAKEARAQGHKPHWWSVALSRFPDLAKRPFIRAQVVGAIDDADQTLRKF